MICRDLPVIYLKYVFYISADKMFNSGQSLCPERAYNLPWFGKLEIGLVIFFSSLLPLFFSEEAW